LGAVPGAIVHDYPYFDRPRDGQLWTIFAEAWRNRSQACCHSVSGGQPTTMRTV
jgi:hypothetical protein